MDAITRAVRDQYERYPYPAGPPKVRATTDLRMLLSYVERGRKAAGPLHVLDAGCGRGVGTLGCATLQPDVHFTGIDINRVALQEISKEAHTRGLDNVLFNEVDLMTLEGLEVPDGGFDAIYSSGVLHHLSDPVAGLRTLRGVLAPHGALALMVYARHGREPLARLQRAIDLLAPRDLPIAERVAPARALAQAMNEQVLAGSPWADTWEEGEVEFVDRCLNVNETSYDIASLWELLAGAGMRFLRWCEPGDWSAEEQFPEGELLEGARALTELDRFKLIEQAFWRPSFELVAARDDSAPRRPLAPREIDGAILAVNPDVSFTIETRSPRGALRIDNLSYTLRKRDPVTVSDGPFSKALLVLRDQNMPFTGAGLVKLLGEEGVAEDLARAAALELLRREIVYRPHATEV